MKKPSLLIVFLSVFIDLIGFGIVIPLLPLYIKDFGAAGWMIGAISASFSLMQFLFAPAWGGFRIGLGVVRFADQQRGCDRGLCDVCLCFHDDRTGRALGVTGFADFCWHRGREFVCRLGVYRRYQPAGKTVAKHGVDWNGFRIWFYCGPDIGCAQ